MIVKEMFVVLDGVIKRKLFLKKFLFFGGGS